jgi:hypothetical protein
MDLTNSPKISHHLWFDKEPEAVRPEASLKVAFSDLAGCGEIQISKTALLFGSDD